MPHEIHFVAQSRIEAPAEEVFRWHAQPDALERLTPPWEPVEIVQRAPGIHDGDRGILARSPGPIQDSVVYLSTAITSKGASSATSRLKVHSTAGNTPIEWSRTAPQVAFSQTTFVRIAAWLCRKVNWLAGSSNAKLVRLFKYRHRVTAEAMRAHDKA